MTTQEQAAGADPAAADVERARVRVGLAYARHYSPPGSYMDRDQINPALDAYEAAIEQRVHEQYAPLRAFLSVRRETVDELLDEAADREDVQSMVFFEGLRAALAGLQSGEQREATDGE